MKIPGLPAHLNIPLLGYGARNWAALSAYAAARLAEALVAVVGVGLWYADFSFAIFDQDFERHPLRALWRWRRSCLRRAHYWRPARYRHQTMSVLLKVARGVESALFLATLGALDSDCWTLLAWSDWYFEQKPDFYN